MASKRLPCPSCMGKSKSRLLHTSYDAENWRCENCGDVKVIPDRRRKAEAGKTVFDRVLAGLEHEVSYGRETWRGLVTMADLEEMSEHHALREWSTHCTFGIVPVPKRTLWSWFHDDWRRERVAKLAEKTGRPVEARVYVTRKSPRSGFTYDVTVSGVYAFTSDERTSYFDL